MTLKGPPVFSFSVLIKENATIYTQHLVCAFGASNSGPCICMASSIQAVVLPCTSDLCSYLVVFSEHCSFLCNTFIIEFKGDKISKLETEAGYKNPMESSHL